MIHMHRHMMSAAVWLALGAAAGCVLTPAGTREERAQAGKAGEMYKKQFSQRALPELPPIATWRDVLSRVFLADGELEAAYFQWRAALERIDAEGSWPNSDVSIGYETMFSGAGVKSFDRMTFEAGFDSALSLSFPTKTAQRAKIALDEARAAGERFRAVKFDLQKKVLFAWADYVLITREIDAKREEVALRKLLVDAGTISTSGGAGQGALVRADIEQRLAEVELEDMVSDQAGMRAMLNSWMHRDVAQPIHVPAEPEALRPVPSSDAEMIALAADEFPEVAMFAREVDGRRDALELARMRWIPDLSPTASFTGTVAQTLGAMITLPTTIPEIRARIREAEADLRAAESVLRQKRAERVGEYIGLLLTLRRAQSRAELVRTSLMPGALRLAEAQQRSYEGGAVMLKDVLESRELLLAVRLLAARADALAERSLVDIECCLGIDIETVGSKEARR